MWKLDSTTPEMLKVLIGDGHKAREDAELIVNNAWE